jgi:IS5 family transposase
MRGYDEKMGLSITQGVLPAMIQPGFFDLIDRYAKLDALGDPLPKIDKVVDWQSFRPILKKIRQKPRKSNAGRPPFDELLMFKTLVLQSLYNLSDDQVEFQVRDRYSFCRFLGLTPEGRIPDAKTVWHFREELKKLNLMEKLFDRLLSQIDSAGFIPRMGQIIDASIVEAPRQRNSRDENKRIKSGDVPEEWSADKKQQKDVDARWTKKHGKTFYGYKNHVSVDHKHKVIRRWSSSSASLHDSQVFNELLDASNSSGDVWADSAYWFA